MKASIQPPYFLITNPAKILHSPLAQFVSRVTSLPLAQVGPGSGDAYAMAAYGLCAMGATYVVALWKGDEEYIYNAVLIRFIVSATGIGISLFSGYGGASLLAMSIGEIALASVLGTVLGTWTGYPKALRKRKD